MLVITILAETDVNNSVNNLCKNLNTPIIAF
jgi:hypothetical protein